MTINQPSETLHVVELFRSIQGESSFAGLPFCFVRLAGCNLDCSWCDTGYAREAAGTEMGVDDVVQKLSKMGPMRALITGGEPLLQAATPVLASRLAEHGFTVLVETNGSVDIAVLREPVIRIVDMKAPSSNMSARMDLANLRRLRSTDQVKFVLADRDDYLWARRLIGEFSLQSTCPILMGAVAGRLALHDLAEWILLDELDVRLQVQLHRIIWGADARGR